MVTRRLIRSLTFHSLNLATTPLLLIKSVEKLKKHDPGFYRVAKTFMRTKDDPFQADFNSGDHFGSTLEPPIPAFMGAIGSQMGMALLRILMELK